MPDEKRDGRDTAPAPGPRDREQAAAEEVTVAVMSAAQLLCAVSARALARADETLTLPQLRALVVLENDGPVKLSALAAALAVNPSTAMRMADRLEHSGLVVRRPNPASRREVIVGLTEHGARLVDTVMEHRRNEVGELVAGLSGEQLEGLVAALRTFTVAGGTEADTGRDPYEAARRTKGLPEGTESTG
ncbi:hypothetical protein N566_19440 [Streptomycetaceae bacterium MP113-05]|nr:hypothetical protein N566_19440 [Streptomycetaceae bacterium MP113-05]